MKIVINRLFIFALLLFACSKEHKNVIDPITPPPTYTSLKMENIQPNHQKPNKVQFLFSLRDQNNHAVTIPYNQIQSVRYDVTENETPIDTDESPVMFHSADDYPMDVVLVLDFSESIAAQPSGIANMVAGAKSIINALKDNHKIALVEFHDNNPHSNYSVLVNFTYDKYYASQVLDTFVSTAIYNGFSTCWDGVNLGLSLFTDTIDPKKVKSLVFLSDGFDNSSVTSVDDLIATAVTKGVHVYNIGFGTILSEYETDLQKISADTGGLYYYAGNATALSQQFAQIVHDLGGNYIISYITSRHTPFNVEISISYDNLITDNKLVDTISPDSISGLDTDGVITYSEPIDNGNLEFYIKAQHVPRQIDKFRFKVIMDYNFPVEISTVDSQDGGLLSAWTPPYQDNDGFWVSEGPKLLFGDFGKLFKVVIANFNLSAINFTIIFDNSVYPSGVAFSGGAPVTLDASGNFISEVIYGTIVGRPAPQNLSSGVALNPELSWELFNPEQSETYRYDVYLDITQNFSERPAGELLVNKRFSPNTPLLPNTAYYWKVITHALNSDELIEGPTWKFTTAAARKK